MGHKAWAIHWYFCWVWQIPNQKEIQNNNVMMRRPGLSTFYPTSTPAGGLDLIVTAFEENIRPGQCQPYFDIFVEFDQSKTTVWWWARLVFFFSHINSRRGLDLMPAFSSSEGGTIRFGLSQNITISASLFKTGTYVILWDSAFSPSKMRTRWRNCCSPLDLALSLWSVLILPAFCRPCWKCRIKYLLQHTTGPHSCLCWDCSLFSKSHDWEASSFKANICQSWKHTLVKGIQ